jgi:transposase-like protein
VICSTNAIESVNARYRRAIRARGHFPTEQAALKCLYLTTRSLDPDRTRQPAMGHEVVESARSAVPALLPVRFCGPLAEPGVR